MNRALLVPLQLHKQFIRSLRRWDKTSKKPAYQKEDGKKYNSVIYYKPDKFEEPKDLPTPPKLFRVQRIARLKGMIYWERNIINELGLLYSIADVAVVSNTPQNCVLLWKVKHLISVEPITFPHGEPVAEDVNYTHLKENGECLVQKRLEVPEERIKATEEFKKDPVRLDKDTLKHDALMHWVSGR